MKYYVSFFVSDPVVVSFKNRKISQGTQGVESGKSLECWRMLTTNSKDLGKEKKEWMEKKDLMESQRSGLSSIIPPVDGTNV